MSRSFVRWPVWIVTRIVLPLCLLIAIGGGIIYVRLLNGAIPLKPIAGPIARAIAADLPGLGVNVEDASLLVAEGGGLELRLREVGFKTEAGATVAHARDAAVSLSSAALWSGRLAPSRIVLIEPKLLLRYSREAGLSLSFDRPDNQSAGDRHPSQAAPVSAPPPATGRGAAGAAAQQDMLAPLAALLGKAGRPTGASSFIKSIGLRNATLAIDNAGEESSLRIAEADFNFDHGSNGSVVGADLSFESQRGRWKLALVATRNESDNALTIEAKLADLVPSGMAAALPGLAALSVVEVPVSGTASLRLSGASELTAATATFDLGRGAIAPGWRGDGRLPIESGRLSFQYQPASRQLVMLPSRIQSGTSWATFTGTVAQTAGPGQPWQIEVQAREGMLGAAEFGIQPKPLESFRMRGSYDADKGNLDISETVLRAAGGEISLTGHVQSSAAGTRTLIQGRLSAMSLEAIKLLWPSPIAPHARRWSGNQIQQGRLTGGTFLVEDVGHGSDRGRAGTASGTRIAVSIEGTNVRILPKPGFSPVEAPRVLVRLEGNMLEVAAPDATIITAPQRRLPLRGLRMVAADVSAPASTGDLTFRAQGALQPALDLAEQQAARNGRTLSLPGEGLDGRVDAQVRIIVPLGDAVTADDTQLDIKGKITDGKARGVFGGYDVNGATIAVELTDQALDAKGEMLVGGVPAKLSMKRIFAAPAGEQPPVLITANLDTADRTQLGLDINDFVIGEMPVEVLISPRPQGEPTVHLRANLTGTEMVIEALGWKKAPGRPATLQFEVVRPNKQRTELQNLRIVGEDISLSGMLALDGRNKAREFSFPELSLHVVSRLQLSGTMRPDNVWDVTVRGKTLDGRDFFQSLFAVGQLHSKPPPPRKDQSGLELKAEIDTVLGHHDLTLKGLKLQMTNRGGRTVAMTARGVVESSGRDAGKPLEVTIQQASREPRRMLARTDDAGQAFRLIGFYPNMLGGRMQLDVNLDGGGNADRHTDKSGQLDVTRFSILGDPVEATGEGAAGPRGQRRMERRRLDFDSMKAPFELGHGYLVIKDADVRGQVLGVLLKGRVDFRAQRLDLGGTYVPLQGLNSAIGNFPILGQILAGPRGEGVIGMTFGITGSMSRPQVTVNPVSIVPGIFRDIFQMTNPNPRITPRDYQPPAAGAKTAAPKGPAVRSSTSPAAVGDAKSTPRASPAPRVDIDGAWSSNQVIAPTPQPARKQ